MLELQTTRELLASSLKKVQDLELESGKVPGLQSRIQELERNLGKPNNTRYVHMYVLTEVRIGSAQWAGAIFNLDQKFRSQNCLFQLL